jgi:gluconolactonase
VDEDGYVLVCGVLGGGIIVFDPTGRVVETIPCRDKLVTNCAFGGTNRSTLYVTASGVGQVVSFEWTRPGLVSWPERKG